MTLPRSSSSILVGRRVLGDGDTAEVEDRAAARLVSLGHATFVAPMAAPAAETATAPPRGEKATARK